MKDPHNTLGNPKDTLMSAGNDLNSAVTWSLILEGGGTRLILIHEGFDPQAPSHVRAHRLMAGGWRGQILKKLTETLRRPRSGYPPVRGSRT